MQRVGLGEPKWLLDQRHLQRPMMTHDHVKSMLSSPGTWLPTRHTCLACPPAVRSQPCLAQAPSMGCPCRARAAQAINMLCDTRIMRAEDACTVFVTLPVC